MQLQKENRFDQIIYTLWIVKNKLKIKNIISITEIKLEIQKNCFTPEQKTFKRKIMKPNCAVSSIFNWKFIYKTSSWSTISKSLPVLDLWLDSLSLSDAFCPVSAPSVVLPSTAIFWSLFFSSISFCGSSSTSEFLSFFFFLSFLLFGS